MKTTHTQFASAPSLSTYREALERCRFTEQSSIAERKLAAADTMLATLIGVRSLMSVEIALGSMAWVKAAALVDDAIREATHGS